MPGGGGGGLDGCGLGGFCVGGFDGCVFGAVVAAVVVIFQLQL